MAYGFFLTSPVTSVLLCLAGEHEAGKGSICRQSRQTGTVQLPSMGSKSVCEQAGRKEGTDKVSGKQRHEATLMVGMMGRKGLVYILAG